LTTFVVIGQSGVRRDSLNPSFKIFNYPKTFTIGYLSVGIQKSFFCDLGIYRMNEGLFFRKKTDFTYHAELEWIPTIVPEKEKNIYGIKTGYQIRQRIFKYGIDISYLTDKSLWDFTITPKIGLTGRWWYCIYYGYNFPINNSFSKIGHHQLSIILLFDHYTFIGRPKGK
jgi:hypothetical protein